ncbi:uncharacterized protein LOC130443315 [Diorhabda sublineata]|uniref:uncharacterized protein LOC130443315 n=1 Tax=Diorhabda sublineata TaxID=1163346 RepID=UPI0024E10823|nr:uncharacterized protein LOC130443315 [Diorhabda sublineata]
MASWIIRTMLAMRKMEEIAKEMLEYQKDILALKEIRWKGKGQINKKKYSLFYGGEDKKGRNGIDFMISHRMERNVLEYEVIKEAKYEDKDEFYVNLVKVCEDITRHDTLLIIGDMNPEIGKKDYLRSVAGKHTLHEITNNNGWRICSLAKEFNIKRNTTHINEKEWSQYFKELLTEEDSEYEEDDISDNGTILENEEKPTEAECNDIIDKLKHNKIGGPDEIVNELIKYGGDKLRYKIFKSMGNRSNAKRVV